ncbi:c-type cytochrome [Pseudomonas sp.]|uniref:c-type cytochrome n=1 Tax=Pseudomonas sp. TaxID=306 RepID=UPI003A980C59
MKPHIPLSVALFSVFFTCASSHAAQLNVELDEQSKSWSTAELLALPQMREINIPADVSYKRAMSYKAVPVAVLLESVKPDEHIQAVAADGFAAELPAARLLKTQGAKAWLAIEEPSKPWPALGNKGYSAGPFYVVWQNPQAGNIGPEQWPYQVATLRRLPAVEERFPALLPATDASEEVKLGFAQYQKNCMACHRLNKAGDSQFGPDLNLPHNPTEYFKSEFLSRYIRDPQSMRHWPQGKMPAFSEASISNVELKQLLAYLGHMAGRKLQ